MASPLFILLGIRLEDFDDHLISIFRVHHEFLLMHVENHQSCQIFNAFFENFPGINLQKFNNLL